MVSKVVFRFLFGEHYLFAVKHLCQHIRECYGINDIDSDGCSNVNQTVTEREYTRHGLDTVVYRNEVPRYGCLCVTAAYC